MHLILTQPNQDTKPGKTEDMIRFAFSDSTLAPVILQGLRQAGRLCADREPLVLLPQQWRQANTKRSTHTAYHNGSFPFHTSTEKKSKAAHWTIITNGRFITSFNRHAINKLLTTMNEDLITIEIEPSLSANYEKILFTSTGHVAGFCRLYSDSLLPSVRPVDWPHHLLVKQNTLERIFENGKMPLRFKDFYRCFETHSLNIRCLKIGGVVMDLQHPNGMLAFISAQLSQQDRSLFTRRNQSRVPASTRIHGPVLIGDHVNIGNNVVIIGPAVLCDGVSIADKTVINTSVIGPHCSITSDQIIKDRIVNTPSNTMINSSSPTGPMAASSQRYVVHHSRDKSISTYRTWPLLSYPRLIKRTADVVASFCILLLLVPVFPVVAVAIKLSSSGPVFFKHKRQGRHGKPFNCLKFRTMIPGADNIQDKLRTKNQVDGPQFKIEDDPRVTSVGRFLRDTYIDELPQFINVLLGQMSFIGPRPSPEKENSQCPVWHDARLSVRPGISGLWQMERTREPGRDFQEWIYYDIEYIRHLSLKTDLQICWKTIKKIATNFFGKF